MIPEPPGEFEHVAPVTYMFFRFMPWSWLVLLPVVVLCLWSWIVKLKPRVQWARLWWGRKVADGLRAIRDDYDVPGH